MKLATGFMLPLRKLCSISSKTTFLKENATLLKTWGWPTMGVIIGLLDTP